MSRRRDGRKPFAWALDDAATGAAVPSLASQGTVCCHVAPDVFIGQSVAMEVTDVTS
jgi:hypothetical protein